MKAKETKALENYKLYLEKNCTKKQLIATIIDMATKYFLKSVVAVHGEKELAETVKFQLTSRKWKKF